MGIFAYSDPHFYHKNIISYTNRPYNNVDKMNNNLVKRYNAVIKPTDVVYFLGDLALMASVQSLYQIIKRMNGTKILIPGNHDKLNIHDYYEVGFAGVYGHLKINYKDREIFLAHDPCWALVPNTLWFCGHVHNSWLKLVTQTNTTIINTSVEMWDYKPVSFDTLLDVADNEDNYITELILNERNERKLLYLTHFEEMTIGCD